MEAYILIGSLTATLIKEQSNLNKEPPLTKLDWFNKGGPLNVCALAGLFKDILMHVYGGVFFGIVGEQLVSLLWSILGKIFHSLVLQQQTPQRLDPIFDGPCQPGKQTASHRSGFTLPLWQKNMVYRFTLIFQTTNVMYLQLHIPQALEV